MAPPDIFDRAARRHRRDRARSGRDDFVRDWIADGLRDRLDIVTRRFAVALELGCGARPLDLPGVDRVIRIDAGFLNARAAGGLQAEEDRLPIADGCVDLVVSAGGLDQVADLPGALALARRVLRPDGLFLAAFLGGGSLPTLRRAMAAADGEQARPRLHPQIDVRTAGDLLSRAGFALPVADTETLDARYAGLDGLLADLRAMAATNLLRARGPLTPAALDRARAAFAAQADADGRVRERFVAIVLTGWAPDPSQPRPAARGSGSASLRDALKPGGAAPGG